MQLGRGAEDLSALHSHTRSRMKIHNAEVLTIDQVGARYCLQLAFPPVVTQSVGGIGQSDEEDRRRRREDKEKRRELGICRATTP